MSAVSTDERSGDSQSEEKGWTPPRRIYFKKQTLGLWRVTDSDGMRHIPVDRAFAYMQELVEDGWRLSMQESVTGSILSVTCTEPER